MTLEEQFVNLFASGSLNRETGFPRTINVEKKPKLTKTRTVYSVGEALTYRGTSNHAQLATGTKRDPRKGR